MKNLDAYIAQLRDLEANLQSKVGDILIANEKAILRMVRERLYRWGTDGEGNPLQPPYAEMTKALKKQKRQITKHVTLRDSGFLYSSLYVEEYKGGVNIFAGARYAEDLMQHYNSRSIFDLTREQADVVAWGIVDPEIQKIIDNLGDIKL